jgi:FKBP-type peptidyl-prolyl cis-trans isomerase
MVKGDGAVFKHGQTALVDWDGYPLGYYGRPFEARNKTKGGAFTGDDKDFIRLSVDDAKVIPAFKEAIMGMRVGCIRRIIVPGGSDLGYPKGKSWTLAMPQPSTFSGKRALGFVLENEGMIDKTLMFDIELIRILDA